MKRSIVLVLSLALLLTACALPFPIPGLTPETPEPTAEPTPEPTPAPTPTPTPTPDWLYESEALGYRISFPAELQASCSVESFEFSDVFRFDPIDAEGGDGFLLEISLVAREDVEAYLTVYDSAKILEKLDGYDIVAGAETGAAFEGVDRDLVNDFRDAQDAMLGALNTLEITREIDVDHTALRYGGDRMTLLNAEQIYAKYVPAVFLVEVYDEYDDMIATGSGFFIDGDGTAVTNWHVIYGATSAVITVTDSDGETRTAEVEGVYDYNKEEDWAIMKVEGSGYSWLQFGGQDSVVGGATVYALGSPEGLSATLSEGLISNPSRTIDGQTYIQTSAAISHGSSGGALINKFGRVIGITCAKIEGGENLNLAVPVTKLANYEKGELVPLSDTYTMASGYVCPDTYTVKLGPGASADVIITAIEYNCDEDTSLYYEIDDESLISCSWGTWVDDYETVPLTVTSNGAYGETTVWLYYYTDSGTLLSYDRFTVRVSPGRLVAEEDYTELRLGESGEVWFDVEAFTADSYKLIYYPSTDDILSLTWGKWSDSVRIPLNMTALKCNVDDYYYVTVDLVDADTEEVWDSVDVYVDVCGGEMTGSEYYLELSVGETGTVTVTGTPYNAGTEVHFDAWVFSDEDVVSYTLGDQKGSSVQLKVTARAAGWESIRIDMLNEDGMILAAYWVSIEITE